MILEVFEKKTNQAPLAMIFDNDDLRTPFRQAVVFENGQRVRLNEPVLEWLKLLLA